MKSRRIIILSIFIAIITTTFLIGLNNNSKIISKAEAEKAASEYVSKNSYYKNAKLGIIKLTTDIYSIIFKKQVWLVSYKDSWLFIDAYNGKVKKTEEHSPEPFVARANEWKTYEFYFSFYLLLNFLIIFYILFRWKWSKKNKFLLSALSIHFFVCIFLYDFCIEIYWLLYAIIYLIMYLIVFSISSIVRKVIEIVI